MVSFYFETQLLVPTPTCIQTLKPAFRAPPDLWRVWRRSHLSWWELCCLWEACGGIQEGPSEMRYSVSSPCTCSLREIRETGNDCQLKHPDFHTCLCRTRALIMRSQFPRRLILSRRNPAESAATQLIPTGEISIPLDVDDNVLNCKSVMGQQRHSG